MNEESRHTPGTVEAVAKVREDYAPPSLKVFGSVGALTQAGTGQTMETGMDAGTSPSSMA